MTNGQGDPVLERALLAVGLTRAIGLHFYGHYVGMAGRPPVGGRARLESAGEPAGVGSPSASAAAVATLADLATGAAIRSHLEPGTLLATMTLSIQHLEAEAVGPLVADGEALPASGGHGAGSCLVRAGEQIVARAQGWFSARPKPPDVPIGLMPWEYEVPPEIVVPTLAELNEREAAAVAAVRAAGERAARDGTAVSQELLSFGWQDCAPGRARGTLEIGPELGNRIGAVQGGALYGASVMAATQALGDERALLAEGHYQYLKPAFGERLVAEASVLRRGRSVAYAETRIHADDALVGVGLVSFRR